MASYLALDRNTAAVAFAMFTMALGEHLWRKFVPKYLEALGAPIVAIGLYGSTEDLLDGLYQYPGGWVADRHGRRHALQLFVGLAASGYAIMALAPSWPIVLLGVVFMMAWRSMASPTLFAVVGDSLPRERRAMGFSVQSILRRIPIAIAPILGGLLIVRSGVVKGVRIGLLVSILLALLTFALVSRIRLELPTLSVAGLRGVWRTFPPPLRRLLLSDIFIRTCEGMVDVFLVLYALNVVGISAPEFGLLIAVQMTTSIVCYLPVARLADRVGRKPFVIATFLAFSLFPLAVISANSFAGLAAAFVVGGLREIGEPSRKALIVDLVSPEARARGVGLYYLVRSLAIAPAATVGGLLWQASPTLPFLLASAMGLVGTAAFALTVREEYAG
ncbi:MAG TPA: MFS transporter [Gemmatimonadales bacterium]|nr:MFS transporter [Gemmatimonadales bacterium]